MSDLKGNENTTKNSNNVKYYNSQHSEEDFRVQAKTSNISDNAMVVLEQRYLLKNTHGNVIETPEALFDRVAKAIADVDYQYGASKEEVEQTTQEFVNIMSSLDFLPNSPTLMNAGTKQGTLSACFVLLLEDSMQGIMHAATAAAMVQKYGGGTGFSLSSIRPKNTPIATTHGKACGPIAVLKHLSSVSSLVTQGGKRDGANMAVMDIHHPDILEFIDCKSKEGDIHNFNISVGASDEFMQAVKQGTTYPLRAKKHPTDPNSQTVVVKEIDARKTFDKITYGAWRNGEPGMVFLNTVNRNHPIAHIGEITATNPCGEQPLLPYESCNLGSIDVGKFVITDGDKPTVDWERLSKVIHTTVHFLDNVIDANQYALEEIRNMTTHTRKIGLGVMGFADMLIKLGIPYDSEEGVSMGSKLMKFFYDQSMIKSMQLAKKRGTFPAFEGSSYEKRGLKVRNGCLLTVAPTGTISMIAGASSGIEPLFALAYRKHNILDNKTLYYVNHEFERIARQQGFYSEDLMEHLSKGGSLQNRNDIPKHIKELFRISADIAPKYHVLMQAAFQKHTDSGISKTINFPNSASQEDVAQAYITAWEQNCKGITVYRAGSRNKEVLTSGHENSASPDKTLKHTKKQVRPTQLSGITKKIKTGRGTVYVTVNSYEDGKPAEVFINHGKAGGNDAAMAQALARTISICLQYGIDPQVIVSQLKDITDIPIWDNGTQIRSVPDATAKVLGDVLSNSEHSGSQEKISVRGSNNNAVTLESCPECESKVIVHEEGCIKCHMCGYSKC